LLTPPPVSATSARRTSRASWDQLARRRRQLGTARDFLHHVLYSHIK
jgi:hypothetical protein